MSRFFSDKYSALEAYTPGEQPRDMQYVKLNTNESPFPPSPNALELAANAAESLQLYCDPTCAKLTEKFAVDGVCTKPSFSSSAVRYARFSMIVPQFFFV